MSVRVMALVWESSVPAPERFTLLALADRADEDGRCWPSIPTLARKCMTGESTIRRHLAKLAVLNVLVIERRWNSSSMYTISRPRLIELAQPQPPSQSDTPCQIDTPSRSDTSQSGTPSQIERTPPPKVSGPPSQSERLSISDTSVDPSDVAPRRPHRIPADFEATDAMKAWARENTPLVGKSETDQFIDFWNAEGTAKARKVDWVKAWQVWMRREQKAAERRPAHLRSVPAPLPPANLRSFEDYRQAAAGKAAAALLGTPYLPTPQPPSDKTPHQQWQRDQAIAWIDAHEQQIRAALAERSTA